MKYIYLTLLSLVATLSAAAQEYAICISHGNTQDYALTTDIDSIYFDASGTTMYVQPLAGGSPVAFAAANIESISSLPASEMPLSLTVNFNSDAATIANPFFLQGVSVETDGAYVTITNNNLTTELTTSLSGSTTNGSLTYIGYYKTTIELNGVSITSQRGAALDIQCGKRVALNLKKETVNTLVDAENGTHKAALYCKGHLEIDKAGTLNVTGRTKHAISAKEYIQLKKSEGTINILAAKGDGIHAGQYYSMKGFTVNIANTEDDGIQAEYKALEEGETYEEDYENGSLYIIDGTLNITSTQDGGIKTDEPETTPEPTKSYKLWVAKPASSNSWGGGSSAWGNLYLYDSAGTQVATVTSSATVTGTNGQSLTFYVYDFGQADGGTYYLKSDDYRSGRSTYAIKSSTFTAPTSGADVYYQISTSYQTSGSTRTYSLTDVSSTYSGGTTTGAAGETFSSSCLKADSLLTMTGGTVSLSNSGLMSKSIKVGSSAMPGTVTISGGSLTCQLTGDMYLNGSDPVYCTAIKTDRYYGTGGTITITATTGKASRAISADALVSISDGIYQITNDCAGLQGSSDTYTAKGITCDQNIELLGGTFVIKMSGTGGKCIKADGTLTIGTDGGEGPQITATTTGTSLGTSSSGGMGGFPGGGSSSSNSSSSKAIKAQGAITVNGGALLVSTASNGAEGLESKTSVTINGGQHYFHCYDDCINSSGPITFAGGTTVCYATNNDAVDSNYGRSGAITISGGNVFAYSSAGSPEEGLDCDNNSYITISGGIAISAGGSQGGGGMGGSSSSIGSASQGYYLGSSPSSYTTTYYYTLCNTSGEAICTYRFEKNVTNSLSLLTAPNLGTGSITVKQGTEAPTSASVIVKNAADIPVFYIAPVVTTTGTAATVTAK